MEAGSSEKQACRRHEDRWYKENAWITGDKELQLPNIIPINLIYYYCEPWLFNEIYFGNQF